MAGAPSYLSRMETMEFTPEERLVIKEMSAEFEHDVEDLTRWITARKTSNRVLEPLLDAADMEFYGDEGTLPEDTFDRLDMLFDEELCDTDGCTEYAADGEGYDGYCGNCADSLDAAGHWD